MEQAEGFLGNSPSPSAQAGLKNSLLRWGSVGALGEDDDDDEDYEREYGFAGEDVENMTMGMADLSRYAQRPGETAIYVQEFGEELWRSCSNYSCGTAGAIILYRHLYGRDGGQYGEHPSYTLHDYGISLREAKRFDDA